MAVRSLCCAGRNPGEPRFNLKPSAAHPVLKYFVWRGVDRVWRACGDPQFRPHAVLQPGDGTAGGMGGRGDNGDADLRRDLRSVDWRMVGSHALAMGSAPSVYVRLRGSGRDRILFPVRSAERMVTEPSAHVHGRDAGDGASAAESL